MNEEEPLGALAGGDLASDPWSLVRRLERTRDLAFAHSIDRRVTELLGPRDGGRYLDVGSGTGEDACELAELVGGGGLVLGVDIGVAELAAATKRADGLKLPIKFVRADALRLPFLDSVFDGCREERVLQHADDPGRAVAEMARVTRSGGRIVACEPDWGTAVIHGADRETTRLILDAWGRSLRHGFIGRALPGLFAAAGLRDIGVDPFTELSRLAGYPSARDQQEWDVTSGAGTALAMGAVSAESVSIWLDQLDEAVRLGTFFMSLTCFLVSGRKR